MSRSRWRHPVRRSGVSAAQSFDIPGLRLASAPDAPDAAKRMGLPAPTRAPAGRRPATLSAGHAPGSAPADARGCPGSAGTTLEDVQAQQAHEEAAEHVLGFSAERLQLGHGARAVRAGRSYAPPRPGPLPVQAGTPPEGG